MIRITMRLIHKLILGFLVVALLGWAMQYIAVDSNKRILEEHYKDNVGSMLSDILHDADVDFYNNIKIFQEYSKSSIVQEALITSNHAYERMGDIQAYINEKDKEWVSVEKYELTPFMEGIINNRLSNEIKEKNDFYQDNYGYMVFGEVFITNRYGANIAQTGKTSDFRQDDEEWWRSAKKNGLYVRDIQYDESADILSADIGVRVDDENGNFIGVVKVLINAEKIVKIMENARLRGLHSEHNSMAYRLLTKDGKVLYSSVEEEAFMDDMSGLFQFHDIHTGEARGEIHSEDENLLLMHAHSEGYKDYKGLGWILVLDHNKDEIFAPISVLRMKLLATSAAVSLFALLIGFLISVSILNRFKKLKKAAAEVGKGNLDTEIEVGSNDEIGELALALREMTEELKVTTVKADDLRKQIEERRMTEEMLLQSRFDWEDTFNNITDMITIHDKNFNIIRANTAAKQILDLPFLQASDAKCFKYYHGTDKAPEGCPSCDCYNTEEPATFEVYEPFLEKFIEIRSMPRFDNNHELIGLTHIVRDISERKRTEELVQRQLKRINALHSIDLAITSSFDLRVTLDIFLEQVIAQMEVDAAAVLLLNQPSQTLEYIISKGFLSSALKHTKLKIGESNAGLAALNREIVSIANLNEGLEGFVRSTHFTDEKFVTYFAVPLVAKGEIKGVLELFNRSLLEVDKDWMEYLETIATQAAIAIDDALLFERLQRSNVELSLAYDTTIEGWSRAMDLRDSTTEGHSQRVADLTIEIARKMGVNEQDITHIRRGALLHDMGKMGIPDSILLKPGKLTEEEWEIMRSHTNLAYDMLHPVEHLKPALDIPYYHHEKWDGTGYPKGLKAEEIPLGARIFAIVDIWDALMSDRPYRGAWTKDKTIEHIKSISGTHLDPDVVEVFLQMQP